MKPILTSRVLAGGQSRSASFRPAVESLEDRCQPGETLFTALAGLSVFGTLPLLQDLGGGAAAMTRELVLPAPSPRHDLDTSLPLVSARAAEPASERIESPPTRPAPHPTSLGNAGTPGTWLDEGLARAVAAGQRSAPTRAASSRPSVPAVVSPAGQNGGNTPHTASPAAVRPAIQPISPIARPIATAPFNASQPVPSEAPPLVPAKAKVVAVRHETALGSPDSVDEQWGTFDGYVGKDCILGTTQWVTGSGAGGPPGVGDRPYAVGTSQDPTTGFNDIFVSRFSSDGSQRDVGLIYVTGSTYSQANAIALDFQGNIFLTGSTDAPLGNGVKSGFALELSPDLTTVIWAVTFSSDPSVGGDAQGYGIQVDPFRSEVWLVGSLFVNDGGNPALAMFLAHLDGNGMVLQAAAYRFAGSNGVPGATEGYGLALNTVDQLYVAGYFFDSSDPAFGNQALIAKFNPDLGFDAALYVINNGDDRAKGVVLDASSSPSITGFVADPSDPTKNDMLYGRFDPNLNTGNVFFITAGVNLFGNGIALNEANQPILVGGTTDPNQVNPPQALLVRLSADIPPQILDAVTFGGSVADVSAGVFTEFDGTVYMVGTTSSPDNVFLMSPGVVQPTYGGDPSDGFVLKLRVHD